MIVLELEFTDDPARLEATPAHRARLQQLHDEGRLVMTGPWADDAGAMLVFDVEDHVLDQIIAGDPYYRTPGVAATARRAWSPLPLS